MHENVPEPARFCPFMLRIVTGYKIIAEHCALATSIIVRKTSMHNSVSNFFYFKISIFLIN